MDTASHMAKDTANNDRRPALQVVDVNERTWLPRYCRGDAACFESLVKAYKGPIYSYLVRSGFDKCTCDDLFQDIFMKIHQAAASYESSKPLKPWIFTIAVNTVRNFIRIRPLPICDTTEIEALDHPSPLPEHVISLRQVLTSLEHAITELPSMQSKVLKLSAINELSQKEIAVILDIPINTVKTHLRRARQTLVGIFLAEGSDE